MAIPKAIGKSQQEPEATKLVQLLLPVNDNNGKTFPEGYYKKVEKKLVEVFGGVTSYMQSPASGLWKDENGSVFRDIVIVYEVMASKVDRSFWNEFSEHLRKEFHQKELVVRQSGVGLL